MIELLQQTLRKAAKRPGKAILQAAVIAAGALTFSAGLAMSGAITALERETYRYRISVANGSTDEAGRFVYARPSAFTLDILDRLPVETQAVKRLAPYNTINWPALRVGSSRFSIRSIAATGADYVGIMGLSIIAGRQFTADESTKGARVVLLSRSVASTLFGSPDTAVGAVIETERGIAMIRGAGQAQSARLATEKFEVIGVYEDPPELARAALGIPDTIIPFGSERPQGMPNQNQTQVRAFVAETDGTAPEGLKPLLANALDVMGAANSAVEAWEGNPATPNAGAAAEARKALSALSSAIAGLGALVLMASVFGIYSSTSMDAADGRKGTAIRRALGEDAMGTISRFASANAVIGIIAGTIGALISIPAYSALAEAAETVLAGAGMSQGGIFATWPPAWAPLMAIALTALACALFSLPPAIGASRASIVEGIQEL
jgi:putative ABC transport system permease protein